MSLLVVIQEMRVQRACTHVTGRMTPNNMTSFLQMV